MKLEIVHEHIFGIYSKEYVVGSILNKKKGAMRALFQPFYVGGIVNMFAICMGVKDEEYSRN